MAHPSQKQGECGDNEHCPAPTYVTEPLCVARMETTKELINSLKKQIWASATTVLFVIALVEIVLKLIAAK